MATLTRPQVVADFLTGTGTKNMTHTGVSVTKTATMTQGTLLLADGTEADDAAVTAGTAVYVIDDMTILNMEVGEVKLVGCVSQLDWVKFISGSLNLSGVALTSGQLTKFGKLYA